MKLSKDAKEHIATEIAAAFAPKMKELRDTEDRAADAMNARVAEIHKAVRAFIDDTVYPGFIKILGKFGKLDPEIVNTSREKFTAIMTFPPAGHGYCSYDIGHNEDDTIRAFGLNKEQKVACDAINNLESEIRKRISYALYEIEINGKKNTLDTIVKRAIETEIDKLK